MSKSAKSIFACLLVLVLLAPNYASSSSKPSYFEFNELLQLYSVDDLDPQLAEKLNLSLSTPFVDNRFTDPPQFNSAMGIGPYLRVAVWNIQRGIEFEAISKLFSDPAGFEAILDPEEFPPNSEERAAILEEAAALRSADVIVLNEVDWGITRTQYRHVPAELAEMLRMNYAFGVQFVELSPVALSKEQPTDEVEAEFLKLAKVDRNLYRGLHGTAILSRFPLHNVTLRQLDHQAYDWFHAEKKGPGMLEKGKREISKRIFLEKTLREVRRGGRMMLTADIVDPRLPDGRFTVVATHLENRTSSKNRRRQLDEVLSSISHVRNPLILAGDMNTSGQDLAPTSIGRELKKRFGNPKFWIQSGVKYAFGIGMFEDLIMSGVTFGRAHANPTVKHIPFIAPNPERQFFDSLKKHRFADGGSFDIGGERERSFGGSRKQWANSNERASLGFVTTYRVARPIKFIGKFKLDWIFVKPSYSGAVEKGESRPFAPHFGRTLRNVNEAVEDRISDHRPLIVDLPLGKVHVDHLKREQ